jgi:hypothetical protein
MQRPEAAPTIAALWRLSSNANALAKVGGSTVALDAAAEIAAEAGYRGTVAQAGDILRREGSFVVQPGPSGRLVVRQADSPAP